MDFIALSRSIEKPDSNDSGSVEYLPDALTGVDVIGLVFGVIDDLDGDIQEVCYVVLYVVDYDDEVGSIDIGRWVVGEVAEVDVDVVVEGVVGRGGIGGGGGGIRRSGGGIGRGGIWGWGICQSYIVFIQIILNLFTELKS